MIKLSSPTGVVYVNPHHVKMVSEDRHTGGTRIWFEWDPNLFAYGASMLVTDSVEEVASLLRTALSPPYG